MLFRKEIWNSRIWREIFLCWMHLYANSLTLISRKQWCAILYNSSWRYCGNASFYMLRRTSTRARTRSGQVAEANYVISAFCPRTSVGIIVPFVLTQECPRKQSGRDKDRLRTGSGICGQVAEWMRIYKIGFRVLSASCLRPSGRAVLWNLSSLSTLLIVCVCVQALPAAQPQPAQSSPTQSSERVVAKVSPWQDQDGCSMDIFNVPGVAPSGSPELFVCDDNDDSSSSSHEVSFPFYLVT